MTNVIRSVFAAMLLCLLAGAAFAQINITPGNPPAQPQYVLAVGGGFPDTSDIHGAMTGTFGVRIADGTYSLTSVDMSTSLDPATKKRAVFTSIRTGAEKIIIQQGPLTLAAHMDGGLSLGNGTAVGLVSGGGTVTYDLPKHPNVFVYATYRALKSPQQDANASSVQSAVSIGIGLKLFKQ